MSWLTLTILSALLLGLYDYFKKVALEGNAVLPVLFGSVVAGILVWLPIVLWSALSPSTLPVDFLHVTGISAHDHLLLFAKAALVGASWLLGYRGLKSLPLSIASPIRATGPFWTILLAVLFLHECPSPRQWLGLTVILAAFVAFTFVGRREGIHFHRNKAVFLMTAATLLGAASTLYDKYLLRNSGLTPCQVQAWFTIYTGVILLPAMALWIRMKTRHAFHLHCAIPMIGLTLLAADLLYFSAISQPDSLIMLIAPVRQSSVMVAFLLGIVMFREKQMRSKAGCVAAIITGVALLY